MGDGFALWTTYDVPVDNSFSNGFDGVGLFLEQWAHRFHGIGRLGADH